MMRRYATTPGAHRLQSPHRRITRIPTNSALLKLQAKANHFPHKNIVQSKVRFKIAERYTPLCSAGGLGDPAGVPDG
jgi:hypothetical protein